MQYAAIRTFTVMSLPRIAFSLLHYYSHPSLASRERPFVKALGNLYPSPRGSRR